MDKEFENLVSTKINSSAEYNNFIDVPIQEISFIDVSERPLTLREMEYLYIMLENTDETI